MRLAALQSIDKKRRIERIGLLDPAPASTFPPRPCGLPAVSVCQTLSHPAHPLVRFTFPPEFPSHRRPGTTVRTPSLGFLPSSRYQHAESTLAGIPSPLCSVHDVSHVLDGLLLRLPLRVYFTPQPRPGFALQGVPLTRSRTGSSPAVALMPLPVVPAPSFTQVLQGAAPVYRALLRSPVRCSTRRFRPRTTRYPPELQSPSGFPFHTVQTTFIACSDHGLSRPSSCRPCKT
jgi:hypothetical protein